MTSLNGDNSWLFSFPRPESERAAVGRAFHHIVFEPWLSGPTTLLSSWIIQITLSRQSAVPDPPSIEAVIQDIERVAAESLGVLHDTIKNQQEGYAGGIDAILLGFHYLDHVHEPTLRLFDKRIPVIATPEAANIVKLWGHFNAINIIHDLPETSHSWRTPELHPGAPLPPWLTPIRLLGHAELNFCLALVWTHLDQDGSEIHEAILSSPHGTRLNEGPLQAFLDAEPQTKKLAMLHGLKEGHSGGIMTALGAKGGLALYRRVGGVKYWVLTHHSKLLYTGIVMWLLWTVDTFRSLEWALEEERKLGGDNSDSHGGRPNLVQVENGDSFILA